MDSRELVLEAMRGRAPRIPLYFWLADPRLEAKIGDIVGVRCWFESLDFLEKGGPFRRGNETRREWCDRLQPDEYDWPSIDALCSEMDRIVAETLKVDLSKSYQLEILGPTEYSEYSCSQGASSHAKELNQIAHHFDFAILTLLDPDKAEMIHSRLFSLLLEAAKRAAGYEGIDSVRVADDFCTYAGPIYRPEFTERIVARQVELGRTISARGKWSVLHSDGDLRKYLPTLAGAYSGLHPLDLRSKSTVLEAYEWAASLAEARLLAPETVFFTGIPIDLLCNPKTSPDALVKVADQVIRHVGATSLVLTTTHRPYPGCSFQDFEEKVSAIRRYLDSRF